MRTIRIEWQGGNKKGAAYFSDHPSSNDLFEIVLVRFVIPLVELIFHFIVVEVDP